MDKKQQEQLSKVSNELGLLQNSALNHKDSLSRLSEAIDLLKS